MTVAQVREVVGRLRYKPGWRFEVSESEVLPGAVDVRVVADVMDAYRPRRRPADPPNTYAVDAQRCRTRRELVAAVYSAVLDLEDHEAGEWFRDGRTRPFNPHARRRR